MGSEHVGWVYRYSPVKGAMFQVHHAIADSVNDMHDHEFWMRMSRLADKARVSRGTAQEAVGWLMGNGFLELLSAEDRRRAGKPARYRFLFPDVDVVFENRSPTSRQIRDPLAADPRGTSRQIRDPLAADPRPFITQESDNGEPKQESLVANAPKTKGTRIPDEFLVTAEMRTWVAGNCPNLDYRDHTARFADYWRAQPGSRGVKTDWVATWRNWMRKANDDTSRSNGHRNGHRPTTAAERALSAFEKGRT